MRLLERLVQHIFDHEGVWFAPMGDIADDFRGRAGVPELP
jgi:hypothetical protein